LLVTESADGILSRLENRDVTRGASHLREERPAPLRLVREFPRRGRRQESDEGIGGLDVFLAELRVRRRVHARREGLASHGLFGGHGGAGDPLLRREGPLDELEQRGNGSLPAETPDATVGEAVGTA